MGKRPVSAVGLLIMIACVVVGFQPTLPSLLLLFATTIFGGYQIKKHAGKEVYDKFVVLFGYFCAGLNFLAAGMIMLTPLDYVDKASGAFLSMLVGMVIITLINNKKNGQKQGDSE